MTKWEKAGLVIGAIETIVIAIAGVIANTQIKNRMKELNLLNETETDIDMNKMAEYCRKVNKD